MYIFAYSTQKQLLQTSGYMLFHSQTTWIENLVSLWVGEHALHFLSLGILDEDFTAFLAFSHKHNNSSLFEDIATADRQDNYVIGYSKYIEYSVPDKILLLFA